jgi:hypothetical protein
MGRLALALLVAAALAMAACGGGGGGGESKEPTPQMGSPVVTGTAAPQMGSPVATGTAAATQEPEDEGTKAARAAAEKTFLKLEDFPTGWKQASAATTTPQELDLPSECQSPVLSRKQPPDSIVQVDSPGFGNGAGLSVASRVIVFHDEGTARNYVDGINKFVETFDRCRQPLLEALGKASTPAENAQIADVTVERLSLDSLGDQSIALRLTTSVEAQGATVLLRSDLLAVRVGRMVSLLGYLSTSLATSDLSEEGRLARIVAARLKDAVNELD